ncbi:methyltransferase [Lysinibacillus sp. SGAir0095]|uniref:methyltransferase n=1 Tax=Lysinibacillus sp. SGAir0095 TaxID=2070463 RepID=UPI0010CD034D|nr:methyltransferase [Lysinibacillus sp. SGAir0095]QCR32656.1 SAM-dependent methyltransferase [Lysinibacillus sp. SGAir0095]
MNEDHYEELLHINTQGNKSDINHSIHYHPYEPTPYSALEELFKHYEVQPNNHVVDFGCGKGRLNFYLHYRFLVSVVGIEMNNTFYQDAMKNRHNYLKKTHRNSETIHFQCCLAEQYEIQPTDNRFYFFNPFSVQIFMKVLNNILLSVEKHKREIDLIFYYASDDYRYFLDQHTEFELIKEIPLPELYVKNTYERFLIYRLTK